MSAGAVEDLQRTISRERDTLGTLEDLESGSREIEEASSAASVAFARASAELSQIPVRRVPTYEHPRLLREAMSLAQSRVLIISPWITPAVVDGGFLGEFESLLRRGVQVHIGFGIKGDSDRRANNPAVDALRRLSADFSNFSLIDMGNTHAKVLIWDQNWVSSSFNWLSFRGDPNRTFRQEEGIFVALPDRVEEAYSEMLDLLGVGNEDRVQIKTPQSGGADTQQLIRGGESHTVEFKETARWNRSVLHLHAPRLDAPTEARSSKSKELSATTRRWKHR